MRKYCIKVKKFTRKITSIHPSSLVCKGQLKVCISLSWLCSMLGKFCFAVGTCRDDTSCSWFKRAKIQQNYIMLGIFFFNLQHLADILIQRDPQPYTVVCWKHTVSSHSCRSAIRYEFHKAKSCCIGVDVRVQCTFCRFNACSSAWWRDFGVHLKTPIDSAAQTARGGTVGQWTLRG